MKQMLGIRMENEVKIGQFGTPEPVDAVISKPNLKHNLTIQPQPSATHTINSVQTFVNNVAIITSQENSSHQQTTSSSASLLYNECYSGLQVIIYY